MPIEARSFSFIDQRADQTREIRVEYTGGDDQMNLDEVHVTLDECRRQQRDGVPSVRVGVDEVNHPLRFLWLERRSRVIIRWTLVSIGFLVL